MLSSSRTRSTGFFEQSPKVQYPTSAEDYTLLEEIGQGVSAKVYRAECLSLNETVAVKMMDLEDQDPGHLEEIRREVASMSMVSHPNLVMVHCSFVEGQFLWVVMPFLSGGSALNIMKWSHPKGLDEPSIATILKEVLKALDYFHRNGNIHRDIKAGNILIDANGAVKLADFGVSAASWGSGAKPHSTFVGTPCWMAPEVMEQVTGYDYHADIWSLGITVLELCHGHAPFAKYPPMKVLMMTLQNPPPQLEAEQAESGHHFTRALRDFVAICLQKDPKRRPSAAKLLEHRFIKEAKKPDFLVKHLLEGIPNLGERTANLNERERARAAERAAAVAAGNLKGAASTDAAAEKKSNAQYMKGVTGWNFDIDEIKAEAAAMTDDGIPTAPRHAMNAVTEGRISETPARPLSPTCGGDEAGLSSPRNSEAVTKQHGRFTVVDVEGSGDGGGAGGGVGGGVGGTISRQLSEQKGRFLVSSESGGGKGAGASTFVGASEPDPSTVAAGAKAAAAPGRDSNPPALQVHNMFQALEAADKHAKVLKEMQVAAQEHANVLKKMHEHMSEQQEKITLLVVNNRWLKQRVNSLEANSIQG